MMNQYKLNTGFNLRRLLITVAVLGLVSYGLFNGRHMIMGPKIEIFMGSGLIETTDNPITIKGRARNVIFISLNERPISIDTEGIFEEKLLLSTGSNIIVVKGRDRFKNEVSETFEVYFKNSSSTIEVNQSR